jgi:hypothetical protein
MRKVQHIFFFLFLFASLRLCVFALNSLCNWGSIQTHSKSTRKTFFCLCGMVMILLAGASELVAAPLPPSPPSLRQNLQRASVGDFIVAAQNKNFILLHIYSKQQEQLIIEEITVPTARMPKECPSWKEWVVQGAPAHTSWVLYRIHCSTGEIQECFSVSRKGWIVLSQNEIFLPTLLNLPLTPIPDEERRKIGPVPDRGTPDWRKVWQPKMVVEGRVIPNVAFTGWKTRWPKDNSELSGKLIEIYLPAEENSYATYFPYWLQVRGGFGKATIHIIDSGRGLISPAPSIPHK